MRMGMTSASIVKESLEQLGAECLVYLPNRFTDGYGPNASVYKYFIEQQGVSLIVTVDNGVAGHEAIDLAQSMGVDVIVTDHHSMPEPYQMPMPSFTLNIQMRIILSNIWLVVAWLSSWRVLC